MRSHPIAAIVILFVTAAGVLAERQTRPGIGAPTPSGTGVLSGLVLTATPTPRPVRRATVRLSGGAGTIARLIGTDDEGRFVFDALPAGSFTLSAARPGYVQTFYGSKHPGRGPGVLIASQGAGRVDVTLRMLPGAAIAGVITDALGRPAPMVAVAAVELRQAGGPAPPSRAITDDRGVYRIYGLAPGEYLVSALPRLATPSIGRAGSGGEVVATTDEEVQWARRALETGAAGPSPLRAAPMPPPGRTVAYAPVYYPGTPDAAAASRVPVTAGEERPGIDLSLRIVPMSRITGSLVDASGQPVTPATVALYPRRRDQSSAADVLVSSGAVTLPRATVSAGAFSIAGVAPGEYTLIARSGSGQRGAPPPPGGSLWSVTDLLVDGLDQSDLVLRLVPGVRLSGAIVFEHSTVAPPDDLSALDLSLTATGSWLGAASAPRASVDRSGTFRFSSLPPGVFSLRITPPTAAWTLKSALLKERDLSDGRFEVKPGGDLDGMVITFTDRPTGISGRLVDAAGGAVTRYSIVVFTTDRSQWLPNARRIRATPPSTDGSFRIAGLPPGEYAIAAAEDVETTDLADPAFLSQLLATAYKFSLGEGELKTQDLRVGG